MAQDELRLEIRESLGDVDPIAWNALIDDNPFVRHEFLWSLETSGCATAQTGWTPQHITAWKGNRLVAAMPLYAKMHSYGEYVFDWAWADAHHKHGIPYYPKLLSAVPFSPVTGPRILTKDSTLRMQLVDTALQVAKPASSMHVLFPNTEDSAALESAGLIRRRGVQFHWYNNDYRTFDDFLSTLSHPKRKKIKQERRKVRESGITFRRVTGKQASSADWNFFYRCYCNTYRAHHSTPYLNLHFFERIASCLPDSILLVVAEQHGEKIASALNLFSATTLYGRYWGAMKDVPCLHFDACYYQAIEFCIEQGIKLFEGGAQGEHKLARGFLPVQTTSFHWLRHTGFSDAVERYLERESAGVGSYIDELNDRAPYKHA